jgi:hypothetical protein
MEELEILGVNVLVKGADAVIMNIATWQKE